jgi:hypothetical protein
MNVNEKQLNILEQNLEDIKRHSYTYIKKIGPQTQIVKINNLAYEALKIIKEKLKQE